MRWNPNVRQQFLRFEAACFGCGCVLGLLVALWRGERGDRGD